VEITPEDGRSDIGPHRATSLVHTRQVSPALTHLTEEGSRRGDELISIGRGLAVPPTTDPAPWAGPDHLYPAAPQTYAHRKTLVPVDLQDGWFRPRQRRRRSRHRPRPRSRRIANDGVRILPPTVPGHPLPRVTPPLGPGQEHTIGAHDRLGWDERAMGFCGDMGILVQRQLTTPIRGVGRSEP
jgi:hypothetical protein